MKKKIDLKLVVATTIWANVGNSDMPLWRPVNSKEYVVNNFDHEPTIEDLGKAVEEASHKIQGGDEITREIISGWQLYLKDALTHSEFFQLNMNGNVDFPPTDLTIANAE